MASAKGLSNPKNATEGGGSNFKEGNVRVDECVFRVHQGNVAEGQPARAPVLARVLKVTRLDEEMEPLTNEHDEPIKEEIVFGFGGKSLAGIHPGNAEGPEDDNPEDADIEPGTEGNTIYLVKDDFKLNKKCAEVQFTDSLLRSGIKEQYIDRYWGPDWKGVVLHMKTNISDDKMKGNDGVERPITYKVADKVHVGPGEAKGKGKGKSEGKAEGKAEGKSEKAAKNGSASDEAQTAIAKILTKLSETLDGQKLTIKALSSQVAKMLDAEGVSTKLHVPVLSKLKDDGWVEKNLGKYDMHWDAEERMVRVGDAEE